MPVLYFLVFSNLCQPLTWLHLNWDLSSTIYEKSKLKLVGTLLIFFNLQDYLAHVPSLQPNFQCCPTKSFSHNTCVMGWLVFKHTLNLKLIFIHMGLDPGWGLAQTLPQLACWLYSISAKSKNKLTGPLSIVLQSCVSYPPTYIRWRMCKVYYWQPFAH